MVAIIKFVISTTLLASASAAAIRRTDASLLASGNGLLEVSDPVLSILGLGPDNTNTDNTPTDNTPTDNTPTDDTDADSLDKRTDGSLLQVVSDPVLAILGLGTDNVDTDNTTADDTDADSLDKRSTGGITSSSKSGTLEVDEPVLQTATKKRTSTTATATSTTTTSAHLTRTTGVAGTVNNVGLPSTIQASSLYGTLLVGGPVLRSDLGVVALD